MSDFESGLACAAIEGAAIRALKVNVNKAILC